MLCTDKIWRHLIHSRYKSEAGLVNTTSITLKRIGIHQIMPFLCSLFGRNQLVLWIGGCCRCWPFYGCWRSVPILHINETSLDLIKPVFCRNGRCRCFDRRIKAISIVCCEEIGIDESVMVNRCNGSSRTINADIFAFRLTRELL